MAHRRVRILFVCLGNICRSPVAEGVFRHKVKEAGLEAHFEIASAGTGDWHVGKPPDARMCAAVKRRAVDISGQRARQVTEADFAAYDHILVMDRSNLENARKLDPAGTYAERIALFREFDPEPGDLQVPDPYYGGPEGFEHVLDIVFRTSDALLQHLRQTHGQ